MFPHFVPRKAQGYTERTVIDMENKHEVALPTTDTTETVEKDENTWDCPEFKVSGIFASHMVLQREKPIKVWGFSTHVGTKVAGCFMGETVTATVGEDNRFCLRFSAHRECEDPQVMVISDEFDHTVTFEDVLIGDVWIIGGQSNAELHLAPCMALTPSMDFYDGDNFRIFFQQGWSGMALGKESNLSQPDIINPDWTWSRPNEESSLNCSAIGWYFAKQLIKHIGTPIGIVMMAAGGVCLRELMPVDLATSLGYSKGANTRIGGAYDTLIHPLVPLAFKAQIFFQGESEGCWFSCANKYDTDLAAYFENERELFGNKFPVYNVQLCDYGDNCFKYFPALDIVRVKQFDALSLVDDMTLTVDMDLPSPEGFDWAHSPRKLELAERLAKLALAKEYGVGRVMDAVSPRPISATLSSDKREILVDFTDVGTGLILTGHDPKGSIDLPVGGFSVGSFDGAHDTRKPAEAKIISRSQVIVTVPEGADISCVNYCFSIRVEPELYNGNNLPCPSFSIKVNC